MIFRGRLKMLLQLKDELILLYTSPAIAVGRRPPAGCSLYAFYQPFLAAKSRNLENVVL
jgi:hypothetical protein